MRGQHYTSNTVSVSKWCNKCGRFTQHSVSGHRAGHCLEHVPEPKKDATSKKPVAVQAGLF